MPFINIWTKLINSFKGFARGLIIKIFGGDGKIALIAGSSCPSLAKDVAKFLGFPLINTTLGAFYNDEREVRIEKSVRGFHVYIIQSIASCVRGSINDILIELFLLIDAARRASAVKITVILPIYGYGKQDKKFEGRQPISAKVIADIIAMLGADNVITIDLHSPSIQGFFNIPVDNLFMINYLLAALKNHLGIKEFDANQFITLSPDIGGVARARWVSMFLKIALAISLKRRPKKDVAEVTEFIGDVSTKIAIAPDDMISTGRTLIELCIHACEKGKAMAVIPIATHPSPKKKALEKILECKYIPILVLASTIEIDPDINIPKGKKLIVVSPAPLIGQAILENNRRGGSVSRLFNIEPQSTGLVYKVYTSTGIEEIYT